MFLSPSSVRGLKCKSNQRNIWISCAIFLTTFLPFYFRLKLPSTAPFMPKPSWLPWGTTSMFCFIYESRLGLTLVIVGPMEGVEGGRERHQDQVLGTIQKLTVAYWTNFAFFSLYKFKSIIVVTPTCCSHVYALAPLQEFVIWVYLFVLCD